MNSEVNNAVTRLRAIRALCGYVEDGSSETLKIFQDDATRTFHIKVGNRGWWGNTFEEVIDKAAESLRP